MPFRNVRRGSRRFVWTGPSPPLIHDAYRIVYDVTGEDAGRRLPFAKFRDRTISTVAKAGSNEPRKTRAFGVIHAPLFQHFNATNCANHGESMWRFWNGNTQRAKGGIKIIGQIRLAYEDDLLFVLKQFADILGTLA